MSYQCSICQEYDHLEEYHGSPILRIPSTFDADLYDQIILILSSLKWIPYVYLEDFWLEFRESKEEDIDCTNMLDRIQDLLKENGYILHKDGLDWFIYQLRKEEG